MRRSQHRGYVWQTWALLLSTCLAQNGLPPIEDFKRMSGGTIAVIDDWLYYDGGQVATSESTDERPSYQINDTIAIDLTKKWTARDVEMVFTPLPEGKRAAMEQAMLYDESEDIFYAWGGAFGYGDTPPGPTLWKFSPDSEGQGSWSRQTSQNPEVFTNIRRNAVAATVNTPNASFIFGGWSTASTDPDPTGNVKGFLSFDFETKAWEDHNDGTPYSEDGTLWGGNAVYVPNFGPNGLVFILGGITRRFEAGSGYIGFRNLHFFDPVTLKWYSQRTSGPTPRGRHQACSVGVAGKNNTFDIFVFGGGNDDYNAQLGEIWVLSLPGFTWTKVYDDPSNDRTEQACAVIGKRQMISWGGMQSWGTSGFGRWGIQDELPYGIGIFDMSSLEWKEEYDPEAAEYEAHESISKFYDDGGVDDIEWSSNDIKALFVEAEPEDNGDDSAGDGGNTPGNDSSNDNSDNKDSSSDSSGPPVGAIAGGVVGGVAAIALIGAAWWFFARRRRNNGGEADSEPSVEEQQQQAYHSKVFQGPYAPVPRGSPGPESQYDMGELQGKMVPPPVEMGSGVSPGYPQGHFVEMDANNYPGYRQQ